MVGDYGPGEVDIRKDYSDDELLGMVKKFPLEFEPGTQWSYSNTGYLLLGIIISKLTDEHWGEYLNDRIFEPLDMKTARVISDSDIIANRAAGYVRDEEGNLRNQCWASPTFLSTADGTLSISPGLPEMGLGATRTQAS